MRDLTFRERCSMAFGLLGVLLVIGSPIYALHEINAQRADSIRTSCNDQNHRHDNTIHELHALVDQLPPARRAQAKRNISSTILLIDALAPKQNCDALVKRRVGQ